MTPKVLIIAAAVFFVLHLGALQSEGRLGDGTPTGDTNTMGAIFGILWPLLLVSGVVWMIVRNVRRRRKREG